MGVLSVAPFAWIVPASERRPRTRATSKIGTVHGRSSRRPQLPTPREHLTKTVRLNVSHSPLGVISISSTAQRSTTHRMTHESLGSWRLGPAHVHPDSTLTEPPLSDANRQRMGVLIGFFAHFRPRLANTYSESPAAKWFHGWAKVADGDVKPFLFVNFMTLKLRPPGVRRAVQGGDHVRLGRDCQRGHNGVAWPAFPLEALACRRSWGSQTLSTRTCAVAGHVCAGRWTR